VQHFFVKAKDEQDRPNLVLPTALLSRFQGYRWPGNIRELENVIERVVVLVGMLQLELPAQGISLEAVEKELIVRDVRLRS
jgi:transcriptional regulator with GAF, ATPase, and Fis domain